MEKDTKKHIVLKILLGLLPAAIFTQNYAWMTANTKLGIGFLIIWAIVVWSVWQLNEKNHIMERLFRLTEIAFFLLPVSAIILSFVLGSKAVGSTTNEFEQAGAAIGTAIGGTFIVVLAFIFGVIGGIIFHLITSKYDKKAQTSSDQQPDTIANKHGVILSLVGVLLLTIVIASIPSTDIKPKQEGELQRAGEAANLTATKPSEPMVTVEILQKGFTEELFQNQIILDIKFNNKTDKDIAGVEGTLSFYDIFENEIMSKYMGYDGGIKANESAVWKAGLDYNQFIDEDVKLKNTELKNLNYRWKLTTIVYSDGTKQSF